MQITIFITKGTFFVKDLQFILKKMKKNELAVILGLHKSNITKWTCKKAIPVKYKEALKYLISAINKEEKLCQQKKITHFISKH